MNPKLIDFLPDDLRRTVRSKRAKRRSGLLAALLLVLSVGVSIHSWNSARQADAARLVGAQLAANVPGVDEVMDRMASEHSELERALRLTDGLVPPICASAVLATLTHMLPEHVTLAGLRLETEDAPRQMIVMLKGYAASNADLMEFQRKLAAAPAFEAVTVSESKASEYMGKRVDEFTVSFQVPLDVHLRAPGALRVACGGAER